MSERSHDQKDRCLDVEQVFQLDIALNDDDTASVRSLVERLPERLTVGQWHFDLSACASLGLNAAAIIAATSADARAQGRPFRVTLPQMNEASAAFAEALGLRAFVDADPARMPDDASQEVLPLRQIHRADFGAPDVVLRMIRHHVPLEADTEEYLSICISEIVQNVEDHAQSAIGAILAARFVRARSEIRVAVVDRGLGVGTTLRRRHPELSGALIALDHVLRGGFTARSRSNNMGVGISNLWAIITRQLHGSVCMLSENGLITSRRDNVTGTQVLLRPFAGTGIFFSVPIRS